MLDAQTLPLDIPIVGGDASPPGLTRDQQRAVDIRAPRVALSAGAGSGKTSVLVERFVSLVEEGNAPDRILAVTFTDKAAGEMKERILRRFADRGDEVNRRRTESAYISTIHGLCARLLRENPLAARLDPSFGVMDALTRGLFLDDALDRLYTDEWFRSAVDQFGTEKRSGYPVLFALIRDAALQPREFGTDAAAEAAFDVEQHVAEALRRVRATWESTRARLLEISDTVQAMRIGGEKHGALHQRMCAVLQALAASGEIDPSLAREFCACTSFTGSASKQPGIAAVRAAFDHAKEVLALMMDLDLAEVERIERERLAPLRIGVYHHAARLQAEYDAYKRDRGLLDFEDLQARALRLLDEPLVRDEYTGRFRHLLLDEAQDTNPVQMQLVERLCGAEGSLFSVGDVKQAIYGFRGADVTLFGGLHAAAGQGRLSLVDNFRSRKEILDIVNVVGAGLWEDGSVPFEALQPGLDYPAEPAMARVELHLLTPAGPKSVPPQPKGTKESAEAVRRREGARLARWIREAVEGTDTRGPLEVYDTRARALRPMRYADIAILTATRTPVPVLEQSLAEAGIPYVKNGGRGFFEGLEVTDVLSALRVILNPLDDVSLLAVLRSPLFGWRDADLVRLRAAAGRRPLWRALGDGFIPADSAPHAASAGVTLQALREWARVVAPASLVERLLEQTGYRAALFQTPQGRARAANLEKLLEFARTFAETEGPALDAFVERATLAGRHLADEGAAPLSSPEDDAVTVSTIHGAKGLEWPAVLLPSLDTEFARVRGGSTYHAPDGVLLVEPYDTGGETLKPLSHYPLRERIKAQDEAEARRLFYVALTRAREYLVLSGRTTYPKGSPGRFNKPLNWCVHQLGINAHDAGDCDTTWGASALRLCYAPLVEEPLGSLRSDEVLHAAREQVRSGTLVQWADNLEPVGNEEITRVIDALFGPGPVPVPPPITTTVTRLTYFYRCPRVYYYDLVLQIEEHPRSRHKSAGGAGEALSPVALGTLVHELLERADLGAEPEAEARRLAFGVGELPDGEPERVRRMLHTVLSDPVMDRARRARRLEREYPFHLALGGNVVQGVIDRVFVDEDGQGVVLDYKSNDLSAPDRVNVLTRAYRPQVELYALAARQAGLVDPKEATIYFLNGPVVRPLPVGAARLAEVEAEASDALSRIAREDWETTGGEKCRACGYRARGFCEIGQAWAESLIEE